MKRTNSIISHRILIGWKPSPLPLSRWEMENKLEGLSNTHLAHKDSIISSIHSLDNSR